MKAFLISALLLFYLRAVCALNITALPVCGVSLPLSLTRFLPFLQKKTIYETIQRTKSSNLLPFSCADTSVTMILLSEPTKALLTPRLSNFV
jgi:hypothetical protein